MGYYCCSTKEGSDGEVIISQIGQDDEGVTEDFQYHDNHIRKNKLKLSDFDKFYRRTSQPLFYMKVNDFF